MRVTLCMKITFVIDYHCPNVLEVDICSPNFHCGKAKKENSELTACHVTSDSDK